MKKIFKPFSLLSLRLLKYLPCLIIILCSSAFADNNFPDSINYYLKNNKGVLVGGFHNRNSFLGTIPVKVYGARVGLDYGKKVSVFVGYYTTYKVVDRRQIKEVKLGVYDTIVRSTNLSYISFGGDYVFHRFKKWDFDIPLMIGFGVGNRKTTINQKQEPNELLFVLPIEMGIRAQYNITYWLSIDASTGLRVSPFNSYEFTSSFYSLGLNIRLGTIYRNINRSLNR